MSDLVQFCILPKSVKSLLSMPFYKEKYLKKRKSTFERHLLLYILEISLSSKGLLRLAWLEKTYFLNSEPRIGIFWDDSLAKSSPLVQLRDLCLKQLPRARRGMIEGNPCIEEKHILRTFASPTWFMRTLGNTF